MNHESHIPENAKLTARTGRWLSPSTWADGKVPGDDSAIYVRPGHNVTLDKNAITCGLAIEGGLIFERSKDITLDNCENIVNAGRLRMGYGNYKHSLFFHEIDESKYVGGGDMVLPTDVGVWTIEKGLLDLQGSNKISWTRVVGSLFKGAFKIPLQSVTGLKPGDQLSIAPTLKGDYKNFEIVTIKSISGKTITINESLQNDHPAVNGFTAEVINLSYTVRIEGKPGARSHIHFCMATSPQIISNVGLRYMGVPVIGRYPFHLHKCGDLTGTVIKNVLARDLGNDCFITHETNGVQYNNCIALNGANDGFSWDAGTLSNNVSYNGCLTASMARIGFMLGEGAGNKITNCVGIGNQLIEYPSSANQKQNVWEDHDNLVHNAKVGNRSWQNDGNNHNPARLTSYNCPTGLISGAYIHNYKWDDIVCDGAIEVWALPWPGGPLDEWGYLQHFLRCKALELIIRNHTLPGGGPILFRDCVFGKVTVNSNNKPGEYHFINCNLKREQFTVINIPVGSLISVNNLDGTSFTIQ